jgi:isopenicillin N synthase-like dioxygenase
MAPTPAFVESLVGGGYTMVRLEHDELARLERLRSEATGFFLLSEDRKRRHGSRDFNFGFRPFGRQYSISPDRPDMNESFTYWADNPEAIPAHDQIGPFVEALRGHRRTVARLARMVLDQFAEHFSYGGRVDFEEASYIEVNWYFPTEDRELLQDRHEDGHLLTILTSDGPGLEVEVEGRMLPITFEPGQLLVMPGSLLTSMTDGLVQPLFHQVRNHRRPRRMSVLYLVNPRLDRPLAPFVTNDTNRDLDVAAQARTSVQMFGLPELPVLDQEPPG